jgi:hypothetical protein
MPNDNAQNTYTGGEQAIIAKTGNPVLDAISGLSGVLTGVAGQVYSVYDSVRERELAREIAKDNAARAPAQAQTITGATNAQDFISNPAMQRNMLYGVAIALVAGGALILAAKKG